MHLNFRKFRFALLPPIMSVGLLVGIMAENRTYLKPDDFEPYHRHAKVAIESLPNMIRSWNGVDADDQIPKEAQILLKPNKILFRRYTDTSLASLNSPRLADLLIVQCKQSGDMVGHYPPICYPSHGEQMVVNQPRDWQVGRMTITGMEYQFVKIEDGQEKRKTVYNFMIVPNRGMVRDMDGVKAAAEDYQQRYYGAAQFQVVFHGLSELDLKQDERDEIFKTLMEPAVPVIEQLSKGAIQ